MIDHVSIGVRDFARAMSFYDTALGCLGLRRLITRDGEAGYGKRYPEFWLNARPDMSAVPQDTGVHVCLRTADVASVDAFHAAALAGGASDDGAPGLRPQYTDTYYAAFVRDVDGNRIEAVTFIADGTS